ncbi:glutathione S-transferase theta-1-like [Cimex lectularius]|uniref:GST N-terminal domain-containing protein n=1 Tax=Cimex lectularius TaxID=79782 RepID=A0A8I6RZG2_CIMLE|nr:glutathione S-transferase theta-1-like [Cimex lectularius]
MSPIIFYFDDLSQPCRAIEIFLLMNDIPHDKKKIKLAKGAQYSDEFVKINPFKKVPVIDDNGFILTESVAILRYLCRQYNVQDHWYPNNSKLRARVDEYLEWQHIGTRAPCALYVWDKVFTPLLTGVGTNERRLNNSFKRMEDSCNCINDIWLKDGKKFLTSYSISIADLLGVTELEELKLTGYDPKEGRPALAAWMERVRNATNPHYDKVHSRLNNLSKKYSTKAKL